MVTTSPLVIVGSGPAGMAAAVEAARASLTVHIYDENASPGGQIYRQAPPPMRSEGTASVGREAERGKRLRAEFEAAGDRIVLHQGATVWGVFSERTLVVWEGGRSVEVRPEVLVLATGAYDRPVPLPGWTLPGVYTAGASQLLVKTQGLRPGKRALVAGTGPLLPVVAGQLAQVGVQVLAVLEAASLRGAWRALPRAWGQWALLGDAWRYWRGLRSAAIPYRRSRTVARILGTGAVEAAVTVALDEAWRPVPGTEQIVDVDVVCLGFGFVPSTQLSQLLDCEHRYTAELGGWVPVVSAAMETTMPGVFAVGDGAGIGGALAAALQGRIAGIAAAARLGALSPPEAAARMQPHQVSLGRLRRLREVLDGLTCVRDGLTDLITPETIVCRCEEVTAAELGEAMAEGMADLAHVKRMTRAGMGYCQGRMCGPALAGLLARRTGVSPETIGPLSIRPPVKPVPLEVMATLHNT
jgi:NADPH-dependent 2,4-dienoyl-CoA reductase/sulfur reductase-like enzyme